jgi:hypothetical protein
MGRTATCALGGGSRRVPPLDGAEQFTESVGGVVVLLHGEAERPTHLGGDATEQRHLLGDEFVVGRLVGVGDQLDHAGAGAAQRVGDAEHLGSRRAEGADLLAARRAVHVRARRGEPECTRTDRLLAQPRHRLDLVGPGGFGDIGTAVAHHVGAQRRMRHLGSDIDGPAESVELVEVLRKGLPPPRHALAQRGTGNVLDAFEQLDEPLVPVGGNGGEPDPAVADHDGGDPVDRRRGEVGVPCDLAVVVRVDVDPSRRDHLAGGVELAPAAAHVGADRDDAVTVDGHVGAAPRRTGAVDHVGVLDHEVVHVPDRTNPCACSSRRTRGASPTVAGAVDLQSRACPRS